MTTKKDFIASAKIIADIPDAKERAHLYAVMGKMYAAQNPRFDWGRWRKACNVELSEPVTTTKG